jgi:hypothetical protein
MLTSSAPAIGMSWAPTTCTPACCNSGYSAHELVLSTIAEIAQAAGYSTNRGKRNSCGQKRGDLEIKRLNVAGASDLNIDVAVVHEFYGSVAQADRHGQLRHTIRIRC